MKDIDNINFRAKSRKSKKQQTKLYNSQQKNNYVLMSPSNNETKNKEQTSSNINNRKILFDQLENIQFNHSSNKKNQKQMSSIGFQQMQTKKKQRKKVKSIDQNIFQEVQQKHFILPLYKKLAQKDRQKQSQKTKKNFSNLSQKGIQDKNKQSNSMIFFILSKNLDRYILDKIEKNQTDKKEDLQSKKPEKSKLNISTPHGNVTLESAFTKPHIVINNFLISQNKIDDIKPKKFKSKQNSPKYNKIKPNKSQKKNLLQKYFDNNKFVKSSKKKNKTQSTKQQKNSLIQQEPKIFLNFKKQKQNNEQFFIYKKKHIIDKILQKKNLTEDKNIGTEFKDIFKNFQNEQKTSELQDLVIEIQQKIKKDGQIPQSSLKYYKIIKLLGKGSFGKVFLGLQRLTNRLVAIKCLKLKNFKDKKKKKIMQEVKISSEFLGHPNIIKILEVFENKKYIFFVMEYAANGDLLSFLKQKKRLDENDAKYMFFQVCIALRYIHSLNVIHRDIKLDNILLDDNYRCKICDFGVSRKMKLNEYITEQCGTPAYLAPEIIQNIGYKNFAADIWSLGVLLYSLVTGNMPFKASSLDDLQQKILSGEFEIPTSLDLSDDLQDLLKKMLETIPKRRITIDQILQHKWLSEINFNSLTMLNVKKFEKNSMLKDFVPQINDFALSHTEDLGFPKDLIIDSIRNKKLDLASACYFNIEKDFI